MYRFIKNQQQFKAALLDSVVTVVAYNNGAVKQGTGFLFDENAQNGLIVITNYHVIQGAQTVFAHFRSEKDPVLCDLVDSRPGLDHLVQGPVSVKTGLPATPISMAFISSFHLGARPGSGK